MNLFKEWTSVINSLNVSPTAPPYYFGWNTYNSSDQITYPEGNENELSSSGGGTHIEFTHFLEESELD
ncbi:MAG: hypothetical protein ABS938_11190 [Psychrobacillus psychrodurans]